MALRNGRPPVAVVVNGVEIRPCPDVVRSGREEGREEALRAAVMGLCEALDIPLPADAVSRLDAMNAKELDEIWLVVKREKRWPY